MKKQRKFEDILKTKYYVIPHISDLRDLIYYSAEKFKNKDAFKLKNSTGKIYGITYEQFAKDVESFGNSLIELGQEGKSIAVIGKNSYKWIVSYIASSVVGIIVPIDKELFPEDIINFLKISECSCLIGERNIFIKNIKL